MTQSISRRNIIASALAAPVAAPSIIAAIGDPKLFLGIDGAAKRSVVIPTMRVFVPCEVREVTEWINLPDVHYSLTEEQAIQRARFDLNLSRSVSVQMREHDLFEEVEA